jgi:hypothetical protein
MEAALRVQYGTANATDTVRACLKECFEKRSATADTD